MDNSCWIIAGATSSIAKEFARLVAKQGDDLILLGRDQEKLKAEQADLQIRYDVSVDCLFFDAIDTHMHEDIVKQCVAIAKKPIHVLVAFGYMPVNDALDCTLSDAVKTMQVNYNGAACFMLALIPFLKNQKKSHVLVLGSVAGDRGRSSNFVYGSAKAGLAQFCEGLRAALFKTGVTVTLMRLGYIDTPLTYGKPGYFLAASPKSCASACLRFAKCGAAARYFPWFWRWIMLIFQSMPRMLFHRLKV